MIPFEALYGRRCNTPISWDNPMNRITLGPEMLKYMQQKVIKIKQNLKITQDRQRIYTDKNQMHKEVKVGENVYLKMKPQKSLLKLGAYAKLAPRHCGPVAYKLVLPTNIIVTSHSCAH
jgi:hypothetical protein